MRHVLMLSIVALSVGGCLSAEESVSSGDGTDLAQRSGNRSPTISGNPQAAIMFGDMYEFEPQSSDPDGDALTFQIENKPSWAIFDSSTGRLSGQTTLGDVGVYKNIVIRVSDGTTNRSLRAFSITVSQSALGRITLNWIAPTQNTDSSPLLDLAGYKIYFGKNPGEYNNEIRIDNAGITTFVVENLVADTYYFVVTALNSAGVESEFSGETVKRVD